MISKTVKICKNFIENVLKKRDWFYQLNIAKDYDLLLLTGSAIKQEKDEFSDIDIFLVCKYATQIKYSLQPVYVFNYDNKIFEVSILSTEKLLNDRYNKRNIHWWHKAHIIKSFNKNYEKAFIQASTLTKKELLDRLWTNFVYFQINTADIVKQINRKELVSTKLLFNENIKIVIDSKLTHNKEFSSWKQFGNILKRLDSQFYSKILCMQNINNLKYLQNYNYELQLYLIKILKKNNFSDEEINNWENHNLEKITFQYK